jgi:hypothetical protein
MIVLREACFAKNDNFCVPARIIVCDGLVVALGDNLLAYRQDGADWRFTNRCGQTRLLKGCLHERGISVAHHSHSMVAGGLPEMS